MSARIPRFARLSRADKAKHGEGVRFQQHATAQQVYEKLDAILAKDPTAFTQTEEDKITYFTRNIQNKDHLATLFADLSEGRLAKIKLEAMRMFLPPPDVMDSDPEFCTQSLDKELTEVVRGTTAPTVAAPAPAPVTPTVAAAQQNEDPDEEDEKKVKELKSRLCPGIDGYFCHRTKVIGLQLCSACNRKQYQKPLQELAKEINNNRRAQVRMEAARIKKIALQALKLDMQKALEQSQQGLEGSSSDNEMSDS